MFISLEIFNLTIAVTVPPAAEFYVLIGVGGWVRLSSWSVMPRGTAVCPLWNSPLTSASAADATKSLRILHFIWIGPFAGDGRFGDFYGWVGSEISK